MRALYSVGLGAMLAFVINAAPAQAQAIRFVSAGGNNANSCTLAAPCRTLQRAVNVVPAGGVVQVLNSAGYGPVTIGKSLTISGDGSIVLVGGGITINSASAVVTLRSLALDGLGSSGTGILISNAAAVHIIDVEVERFTSNGIQLNSASELFVTDSVSRDNGGHGLGVNAAAKVTIDNSRFENNGNIGVYIIGAESAITRSAASGSAGFGIRQDGGSMIVTWTTAANNVNAGYYVSSGQMTLESSVARGNGFAGLWVDSGATAQISNSVVTTNNVGIDNDGTLLTRQNNTVSGNNFGDTSGTLTPLAGV